MSALHAARVAEGYHRAKRVAYAHARSFYVASFALFGARRRAAFALYAFCRRLDDMVDGQSEAARRTLPQGALPALTGPAATSAELARRLAAARGLVSSLFSSGPWAPPDEAGPWHPAELAALKDTLGRYALPEAPFQDLISGMEMDLTQARYRTFAELDLYCYRVAGTVGLMLTPVLGYADEAALPHAADLGRAMQLTNILRDVSEDLERGRCYLPLDELSAFGLTPQTLASSPRTPELIRAQVERARGYYASAMRGVPYLRGFGSQRMVALMGALYSRILQVIERRGYDVFAGRASLSMGRKLWVAAATLLHPGGAVPSRRLLPGQAAS